MQKIYFFCLMISAVMAKSQIISIPDANLKAKLLTFGSIFNSAGNNFNVDTNNDGEIQVSEAQAVAKIKITLDASISSALTGLSGFPFLGELELSNLNHPSSAFSFSNYPSLTKLSIHGGEAANISIGNMASLNTVNISSTVSGISIQNAHVNNVEISSFGAGSINLTGCNNLSKLKIEGFAGLSLDLSNLSQLQEVNINNNSSLANINFSGSTGLKKISTANNNLTALNIPNPSIVTDLEITGNHFQSFNLGPYTGLLRFAAINNQLTQLNFSTNPLISQVYIGNNSLTSLTFNNNPLLQYLFAGNNQLANVNFSQLPFLQSLQCGNNLFTVLDFTQNSHLLSFECSNNPNLQTLLMKNGVDNYSGTGSGFSFANTPQLQYICIDPSEIYVVNNLLYSYNQTNVVVNSYCTFTPGGNYYTLQGNTRYDANADGCDPNDLPKPFQKFSIFNFNTGSTVAISDHTGAYSVPVTAGSVSVTPILENPGYFIVSPPTYSVTFPSQASPFIQNFCLTANGTHNDLEVVVIPLNAARPGFNASYKIIYKNKGTAAQSGSLSFTYNDNVTDYLGATVVPASQSSGLLNWNYSNLLPFETRSITVNLKLNTPTQVPPLNGNDLLPFSSQIQGATDETPADNLFVLSQKVVNSFDPNDKTCLEGTSILQAKVGDYVHYMIRFENTGTASAQNIVVTDEIDISKFELSSLQVLSGSHPFTTRVTGNKVEFIFQNIQLPFDDANNDGYVTFKIKTKSTLTAGNTFSNLAKIYFDYNSPISTNSYTTTVQNLLSTSENASVKNSVSIHPNPVRDVLFIKSKNETTRVEVYDASGRVMISVPVKSSAMDVSELSKGSYIIKIHTRDHVEIQKFIKN